MTESTKQRSKHVYFTELTVEGVKCFRSKQTLNLTSKGKLARWTILLGDNGTGKTTLLRLVALLRPVMLQAQDKKEPETSPAWRASPLKGYGTSMGHDKQNAIAELSVVEESKILGEVGEPHRLGALRDAGTQLTDFAWSGKLPNVHQSTFGYGFNRRLQTTPIVSGDEIAPDRSILADVRTLFDADAPLIPAEEWYLQRDYAALRLPEGSTERAQAKTELARIERVLLSLLPEITRLEVVVPDPKAGGAQLHAHTQFGRVRITELGQGYQSTLAWVTDLAARMTAAYPESANPLAEPAVVLVDEIDLHLHPRWQRTLLAQLTEQFPNVQWIVTAHSPLIVQNAPEGTNIAVLRREGDQVTIDNNPQTVRDWRLDQILTSDLFGIPSARAKTYDDVIEKRDALLEKSHLTPLEQQELDALETKLAGFTFGEGKLEMEVNRVLELAAKEKSPR